MISAIETPGSNFFSPGGRTVPSEARKVSLIRTPEEAIRKRWTKISTFPSESGGSGKPDSRRTKPGVQSVEEEVPRAAYVSDTCALDQGFASDTRAPKRSDMIRRRNKISVEASEPGSSSAPGSWSKKPHFMTVEEDVLRRLLREEISVVCRDFAAMGQNGIIPCEENGHGYDSCGRCAPGSIEEKSPQSGPELTPGTDTTAEVEPISEKHAYDPGTAVDWEVHENEALDRRSQLDPPMGNQDPWAFVKDWMIEREGRRFRLFIARLGLEDVVDRAVEYVSNYEEPPREGLLAKSVDSSWYDCVCTAVIIANGFTMYFRANWDVEHPTADVPLDMFLPECFFIMFFAVELALKIFVHRMGYFIGNDISERAWNWFDFLLVLASTVQLFRLSSPGNPSGNLLFLKTAKVLRVLRFMRYFSELRLILHSLVGSVTSLFWSVVMMVLIIYIFGLLFIQATSTYLLESGGTIHDRSNESLREHFGDVGTAMLSLFMICTGGNDWTVFYQALSPVAPVSKALFLFFIAFSQIALLNILTGIFVENALQLAEPDRDSRILEKHRAHIADIKALDEMCATMDTDKSGTIDINEFLKQLHTEGSAVRMTFYDLGLHTAETMQFFKLLKRHSENHNEGVDIDSFVQGVLKLKGGATSLDMQAMQFQAKLLLKNLKEVKADIKDLKAVQNPMRMPLAVPAQLKELAGSRGDQPGGLQGTVCAAGSTHLNL